MRFDARTFRWPSLTFFAALETTQVLGTLAAVFGILMHPIGLKYAAIAWAMRLRRCF
ncbi:MAG: hypothetical protein ACRES9_06865 [Gammaproteobacteria bacterium]